MNDETIYIGIVVITLVILLLVASVVISIFIANRQRLRQEMRLSQLELVYEKELRNAELEVREQLISHVSRELHDHVGHTLTYMRLIIETRKLDSPEVAASFQPFEELLDQASGQLRLLSRSMNMDYLSGLTFQDAINEEVARLSSFTTMEVEYKPGTFKYPKMDKDQMLMSFRIFQELINNTIKHSNATKLIVKSNSSDFLLQVSDNGKGFSIDGALNSGKANGLKNMKKRASLAKLELEFNSELNKGTTVSLVLA
ncbi:MAG: ATP-binding protein [Bacteroidia bacterium]